MHRSRITYLFLTSFVIAVGLASRSKLVAPMPEFLTKYAGDVLWALMLFLLVGVVFPRWRTSVVALVAIAISIAVEFSQLYHGDWLNQIRATRLGALALGNEFRGSDLTCYALGILIGAVGEALFSVHRKRLGVQDRID